MPARPYESSHPWISFAHLETQNRLWMLLGEALSKCQHLSGTPMQPALARDLARVYMIKGAVANTAIEGNTLTEEEVTELQDTKARLPESEVYLQQEVENVLAALTDIDHGVRERRPFDLCTSWIKEQNAKVLKDLEVQEHVTPGEFTQDRLVVNGYRGAPPEDVEYLMDRLCHWLNTEWLAPLQKPETTNDQRFMLSFFAASLAHLYIAWIHPFGDGNGRTARLVECAILAHSGVVPWVSANLLSDHYNRTRTRYYSRLENASRKNDVAGFIAYSAEGFVDKLRDQVVRVQQEQRRVGWINYVHETMEEDPSGQARTRRRALVLALREEAPVKRADLRRVTPEIVEMYAGKGDRTLTRDINVLRAKGLITVVPRKGFIPAIHVMDAFLPAGPFHADDW